MSSTDQYLSPERVGNFRDLICPAPKCCHVFGYHNGLILFLGNKATIRTKVELICPNCKKVRKWRPNDEST